MCQKLRRLPAVLQSGGTEREIKRLQPKSSRGFPGQERASQPVMVRRALAICSLVFGAGTILLHAQAVGKPVAAGGSAAFEMPKDTANAPAVPSPNAAGSPVGVAKTRGVPDDYKIGAGDVLQIAVWKEPEASVPSVVVRPDGRISMPLLKEVAVAGMTPREAEKEITDKLTDLIHAADVTVIVTTITSKKVYIVGAAKKEGPLAYTYRMTVMQAISEAGGLTDYAKKKKIYVLHTDNGKEYRLPFNYDEVIRGEKMEQNIQLSPGDTVLIPH